MTFATKSLRLSVLLLCLVILTHAHLHAGRWSPVHPMGEEEEQSIVLSFFHQNVDQLDVLFWDVSDVHSENYGKYKTPEQLAELIALPAADIEDAISWLASKGITKCDLYRTNDAMRCTAPVATLSQVFSVPVDSFSHFQCIFSGNTIRRSTSKYILPEALEKYFEFIHGFSDFPPLSLNHKYGGLAKEIEEGKNEELLQRPIYISVRSRVLNEIVVELIPPCTTSTFDAMLGNGVCTGNPVVSASVTLSPALDTMDVPKKQYTDLPVDCTLETGYGSFSYCSFTINQVPEYIPWLIEYQLLYQDGTSSASLSYPYFSVSTPQLVVQSVMDMYSIPKGLRVTNSSATQCVVEFEQQFYSPSDLSLFFELNGLDDYSDLVTLIGPNQSTMPGTEGNLDIQWMMGMAPGSPTIYWSNYANSTKEIDHILTWQYEIGNMTSPPLVSSLSYAMTESTANNYLGDGYIQRSNTQFQVLATMGLTMIFSAGDAGANSLSAPPMGVISCSPSHAMWPAESPFVTALSATYFTPLTDPICYLSTANGGINCADNPLGEAAVGINYGMFWTTGGGFSDVSPQPSYQSDVVTQYLTNHPQPPSSYFNPSGRGYPDVATVGHNLEIVLDGNSRVLDGTSASAPIFGGMVTLLNDLLLNEGRAPLGFINPLFYELSATKTGSFKDITVGDNSCGGFGPPVCCANGFLATPGWDAVSGLGSPNFLVLWNAIKELTS